MKKIVILLSLLFVITIFPIESFCAEKPSIYNIKSKSAVLIDAETGSVLFDKNMNMKMYPASITKIMTAMLALEQKELNDVLTTSHNAVYSLPFNTSHIALFEDEQLTLEQALYALGIESANDASNVIAENTYGSIENFAQKMTEKAKLLGAVNTNFTNPHGLPDDNHYTTAYDMALITAQAIKVPELTRFFSTNRYDMGPTNKRDVIRQFWNANDFVNKNKTCEGLVMSKTGWTQAAEHTLVTVCERNGVTLIAVVMSSKHKRDKFDDTQLLMDYGFENFHSTSVDSNDIIKNAPKTIQYPDGTQANIDLRSILAEDMDVVVPKDYSKDNITFKFDEAKFNESQNHITINTNLFYNNGQEDIWAGNQIISVVLDTDLPEDTSGKIVVIFQKIFYILIIVVLWAIIAGLVFIAIKQLIILENRRRNRKRQQKRKKILHDMNKKENKNL